MKVMLIGLDCAEPSLVFEQWRDRLPTLSRLMEHGRYGRLTSVVPPITVPAWSCMMASRTPGDLGIYGFRNRADRSYDATFVANGDAVHAPRLWDYATREGKPSIVVGVPGTYPPRPLNGVLVSCFLTPAGAAFTYPPMVQRELEGYTFDCASFRTEQRDALLREAYEMTDARFRAAEHLLSTRPWELFAMVEIGLDRMEHAFWKDMEDEVEPYADAIFDYYLHLDGAIARLLGHADDDTAVFVVSDHGATRMLGGVRVNEWLRREGLLRLHTEPAERMSLAQADVDWANTVAWGDGGYYARIFVNLEGREPQGAVPAADYDRVRSELAERLAALPGPDGEPLGTRVFRPEDVYDEVNGIPPDLIVYFGDLGWRSIGTVGGDDGIYTFENDTGPDGANHAQDGLLILHAPGVAAGEVDGMHLLDVAPTALELLGIERPASLRGRSLL